MKGKTTTDVEKHLVGMGTDSWFSKGVSNDN